MIDPAFSFGRVAAQYELGRPTWPPAAVDVVIGDLGLRPEGAVLDLGAGTGKLTALLVARFARVIAVEPVAEMHALITAEAEVLEGTAEGIPVRDSSASAVFCGESFHWFDWPGAIAEIVRVLEPGGGLALMWNRPSGGLDSADWPPAVREALGRLVDPSPAERRYQSFAWRDALDGSPFEELRAATFPNGGEIGRDALIARIASWSPVAALPEEEHEAFLAGIAKHLTEPTYNTMLDTHLYWTRLVSA